MKILNLAEIHHINGGSSPNSVNAESIKSASHKPETIESHQTSSFWDVPGSFGSLQSTEKERIGKCGLPIGCGKRVRKEDLYA